MSLASETLTTPELLKSEHLILRAIALPKPMPKDSWFLQLRLSDESYQQALESIRIQSQHTEAPKHSDYKKTN